MANEFWYQVSLVIVHPSMDPKKISQAIRSLTPCVETLAGSEHRPARKRPGTHPRRALLSVWRAQLHAEETLYSGERPISDFILNCLPSLEEHRDLFWSLRTEGKVVLAVNWFADEHHSAGVLSAETLTICGDLGLDLELYLYGYVPSRRPLE
jgi:hypothetical protein